MSRSRKGLFGALALFAVTIFGLTSCSSNEIEGWHWLGADAPPFTNNQGCWFNLFQEPVGLLGVTGERVVIRATTNACKGAPEQAIRVRRVSCYYAFTDTVVTGHILDTDTCPRTEPGNSGAYLVYVNQGYTQPVIGDT